MRRARKAQRGNEMQEGRHRTLRCRGAGCSALGPTASHTPPPAPPPPRRRRKFLRTRRPAILALLLGAHTNVVTVRKDLSLKLKEEYHTFRRGGVAMGLVGGVPKP